MRDRSGKILAEICSVLEYLEDRSEFMDNFFTLTNVRYTSIETIPKIEVILDDLLYEITAVLKGPATKDQLETAGAVEEEE